MAGISGSQSVKANRNVSVDGIIVNVPNGTLGNAVTSITYMKMSTLGFVHSYLSFVLQNTSITFFATADSDSVADADAQWDPVTSYLTGQESVSESFTLNMDTVQSFARLKAVRLTNNATNACAIRAVRNN